MFTCRLRQLRSDQGGFALIEVLISAMIVVMITGAVVQTLTATGRASTEERHRSQAFSVAQEDQERLRSMQISSLQQGLTPRVVTVGNTPFTVTSTATYVSDKTGTAQCGGEGKADYVQIGSSVTWPTMHEGQAPVKIESILSPTSGSVDATSGGLAVAIRNSRVEKNGIAGVALSVSGPATFFGSTNSEGCALFGGVPTGRYKIVPKLPSTDYVDPEGNKPKTLEADVAGGITTYLEAHYDHAGAVEAIFSVRQKKEVEGTHPYVAANADSIVVRNATVPAKTFGRAGGTPEPVIRGTPLYPFESSYNVWAGSCVQTEPALQPEPAAQATPVVPVGNSIKVMVKLPPLYLTVKNTAMLAERTAASGATVTLTDLHCANSEEKPLVRTYKTTALGSLGENLAVGIPEYETPGVPTGEYEVCASKRGRHVTGTVMVKSLEGNSLTLDLAEAGEKSGECP